MKISTINIYGAFDRINYGDLLFPLVVAYCAKKAGLLGELRYYAPTKSDLSAYGGVVTRSVRDLASDLRLATEEQGDDILIVAGGEVLSATWGGFISSLLPNDFLGKVERIARRRIGEKFFAHLYARLFKFPSLLPFVLADNDFPMVRVAYNAVGGSHLSTSNEFVRRESFARLAKVSYLSVRDTKTKSILDSHVPTSVHVSPDSVVILSDMYPLNTLSARISDSVREMQQRTPRYICFQSTYEAAKGSDVLIEEQIVIACRDLDVKCVFFDIGKAAGHSDEATVDLMASRPGLRDVGAFILCANMFDIMSIIGNSMLYCGTSLHGAITAISYEKPVVGLCPSKVIKLEAFLTTWGASGRYRLAEYDSLAGAANELLRESNVQPDNGSHLAQLKNRVHENFARMFSALECSPERHDLSHAREAVRIC